MAITGYLALSALSAGSSISAEARSSCITPEGDNLMSVGMVWGLFALVLAAAALRLALRR